MMRLRRSFSCDYINEDSSTVFLPGEGSEAHESHHHHTTTATTSGHHPSLHISGSNSVPGGTGSSPPSSDSKGLSPFHLGGHGLPLNASPSSTSTLTNGLSSWNPDIDDALAADFDGSLSGLGMEGGTNPYNMSDALMALPSVKNEHHFGTGPSTCGQKSSHNRQIIDHHYDVSQEPEVRPVAIVHGKKNRLALGHDDEEASMTSGIKRVCISNERDILTQGSSRFTDHSSNSQTHNTNSRDSCESMTECNQEDCDHSLSRCNKHSNSAPDLRPVRNHQNNNHNSHNGSHNHSTDSSPSPSMSMSLTLGQNDSSKDVPSNRKYSVVPFEYTLQAATSVATKLHEETMTYLNQGQSYEIKLRKLPPIGNYKKVRSVIRVGFYERRLQFQERELIDQWRAQRHLERILEIDVPLSYGITDIVNDPIDINRCAFTWDTTRDTGIYIKVNCISTEFTPKKHGGEKGVPFRVIIETHAFSSPSIRPSLDTILHAASSQVKVFKPKGADRKHKTDREKLSKRGGQCDNFRPAYDVTKFTDFPIDQVYSAPHHPLTTFVASSPATSNGTSGGIFNYSSPATSPSERRLSHESPGDADGPLDFTSNATSPGKPAVRYQISTASPATSPSPAVVSITNRRIAISPSVSKSPPPPSASVVSPTSNNVISPSLPTTLRADASQIEANQWLIANRFESHLKTFLNFSGADLLRLTRGDLIQLCGESDGIRLYNCLHHHPRRQARCTIYVRSACSPDEDFSAVFLESLTERELKSKLGNLLCTSSGLNGSEASTHPSPSLITRIRVKGPQGVPILVTDDFIQNIPQESLFLVDFEKDANGYRAMLKNYVST